MHLVECMRKFCDREIFLNIIIIIIFIIIIIIMIFWENVVLWAV